LISIAIEFASCLNSVNTKFFPALYTIILKGPKYMSIQYARSVSYAVQADMSFRNLAALKAVAESITYNIGFLSRYITLIIIE
jgi:hypothetical protein